MAVEHSPKGYTHSTDAKDRPTRSDRQRRKVRGGGGGRVMVCSGVADPGPTLGILWRLGGGGGEGRGAPKGDRPKCGRAGALGGFVPTGDLAHRRPVGHASATVTAVPPF